MGENCAAPATVPIFLQRLLDQIAVREGFAHGYTITTMSGSSIGDGFQAVMLRTSISGRRHNVAAQRLALICKVPPAAEFRRNLAAPFFQQEVFAYETLLPTLETWQKSKNIDAADGFYAFPRCFGTFSDDQSKNYAIVLEDLCARGARMWNKFDSIDYAHVRLVMSELGKYHALSFALRDQRPELLREYAARESGMMHVYKDFKPGHEFYLRAFDKAIGVLTTTEDELVRIKLVKLRDNYRDVMARVTSGQQAEPFSVVNHGDCWNNNMMFVYDDEQSRVAKAVVVIDWQLGQYCSPATDLATFIYTSTECALRAEHYDDLLQVYHSSLTALLNRMGSDARQLFPFDAFLEQMKNYAIYAMIIAPILVQIITVDPSELPDMDKADPEADENFEFMSNTTLKYEVRMREVLYDFNARGFFDSHHFDLK